MNWFQISLYVAGAISVIAILIQVTSFIIPLFSNIEERIVNIIIQKVHRNIVRDNYFVRVRRRYLETVYRDIIKKKNSNRISVFEILKLLKGVKQIAKANGIEPNALFMAVEELNGDTLLSVGELASLIGKGIDRKQIILKARREYTFDEIIESQHMPIEWSDKIYNRTPAFYENFKGRFNEF